MAVESKPEEKVEDSETQLRKRRIEIRPRRSTTTAKPTQKLPEFPNFPLIFEQANDNLKLNATPKENIEELPIPEPVTMAKSASFRLKNHARRKVDALPVNLTPEALRQPLYDDYYDDYYYDYYYDDLPEQKLPPFKPLAPKKPYQERPVIKEPPRKPTRHSPPKSER